MKKISPGEIKIFIPYVNKLTGIVLDQSKAYLIESRLGPLVDSIGCDTYSQLYTKARSDASKRIEKSIIDAITTNETYFFRDKAPFDLLKFKIIPDQIDKIKTTRDMRPSLSIWSAACSTGQEIYSVGMVLKEIIPDISRWQITLRGTDISDAAVLQASGGRYSKVEVERGMAPAQIQKYFNQEGNQWKVKDDLRAMVQFRKGNLLQPILGMPKFDIVLARNVAIYFSMDNRKIMYSQLANQLKPGGALMIGASESLMGISDRFQQQNYMNSIFYALK
ncbi:MAG: protein-glutamate O-methyltransferase CheR [Candidatus Marinimicrobia bacterium]|nr:protein-glutamate O-methyltransferase CheR [Candidatus Neomarinimicrobiota bacterium]